MPLSFSWNGQTLDFSFDFTIWCESISAFVYPIVVALGALHALYIVSGVRENG
ncbi:virulence factor TspB C-terminal domain-related protein [Acinetobacter pittii]|uniref:virulence factor TspB C-terminal domain-related protein n=1 Tax=Acinetobacter pittii TaxID=48296 RepID=UPI003B58842E